MSGIENICSNSATDNCSLVAVGRKCGSIEIVNVVNGNIEWSKGTSESPETSNNLNSDDDMDGNDLSVRGIHAFCDTPEAGSIKDRLCLLYIRQNGEVGCLKPFQEDFSNEIIFKCPSKVCCTSFDVETRTLGVGCKGAELRLYSLDQPNMPKFSAKGGKPNKVGLVDKPWNTAISFVPNSNATKILVGTGHHKIRMYDATCGKRPQMEISLGEARITSLAIEADGRLCWASNGIGQIEGIDLGENPSKLSLQGSLKGFTGSVRQMKVCPESSINAIAAVGLDRYLRIYSTANRKRFCKVYLKTQLNCLAWCPQIKGAASTTEQALEDKSNLEQHSESLHPTSGENKPTSIDERENRIDKKHHRNHHSISVSKKRKKNVASSIL